MKKVLQGLFSIQSLKNKYLSLAILTAFFSLAAHAQYDSTKLLQDQNSYGFSWKNGEFKSSFKIPKDTPHLARKDSGAIAYKGRNFWIYNGYSWVISTSGTVVSPGNGIDSASYINSTFCIYKNGNPTCFDFSKSICYQQLNYNHTKFLQYNCNAELLDSVDFPITVVQTLAPITGYHSGNGLIDTFTIGSTSSASDRGTGGYVTWSGSGLKFYVSPAQYSIGDSLYTSGQDSVTLSPADPSNPRIDNIVLNTNRRAAIDTGVASMNPAFPQEKITEWKRTSVQVNAGATTPSNIIQKYLYREHLEWNLGASNALTANLDGGTPYEGSKSIDVSFSTNDAFFILDASPSPLNASPYSVLNFRIRLKAAFTGKNLWLVWRSSTVNVSTQVRITSIYGLDPSLVGVYQNVSIPMTDFKITDNNLTSIRFYFSGGSSSGGCFIDAVNLQGGITTGSTPYVENAYKRVDSFFYKKNGVEFFIGKDSVGTGGGGGSGGLKVISNIPTLEAFSGTDTTVFVSDTLRGGIFNYTTNSLAPDSGIVFRADGKGSGFWKRNVTGDFYAKWFGIVANSAADQTKITQIAINSRYNNGGGRLLFKPGKYAIKDTLRTIVNGSACNCQIYIPLTRYGLDSARSVIIEGEGFTNMTSPINGGVEGYNVMFASDITGSGTIPSVFGTPTFFTAGLGNRNSTFLEMRNIVVRTDTAKGMSAINMGALRNLIVDNVSVEKNVSSLAAYNPNGDGTYGVIFPDVLNFGYIGGGTLRALNYNFGVVPGEHMNLDNLYTSYCGVGLYNKTAQQHPIYIGVMNMEHCTNGIRLDNNANIRINSYQAEHWNAGNQWYSNVNDVYVFNGSITTNLYIKHAAVVEANTGTIIDSFKTNNASKVVVSSVNEHNLIWGTAGNITKSGIDRFGTLNNTSIPIITNNTEVARFDSIGNVGIGKPAPAYKLDIASSSAQDGIRVVNSNTGTAASSFFTFVNNAGQYGTMEEFGGNHTDLLLRNNTSISSSNDLLIRSDRNSISGGIYSLKFFTGGTASSQERMRIFSNGAVGINQTTDSTNGKLIVNGTLHLSTALINMGATTKGITQYTSNSTNDAVKIFNSGLGATLGIQNNNPSGFSGIEFGSPTHTFIGANNANGEFRFNNVAAGGFIGFKINSVDKLTIANSGAIGINNASPDSTLTVSGGVRLPSLFPSNNISDSMVVIKANGSLGYRSVPSGSGTSFANPTALIGLTAINGVATTAMRSDAAQAINTAIAPTWTNLHNFSANLLTKKITASGVANDSLVLRADTASTGNTGTNVGIGFNVGNNGNTRAMSILHNGSVGFGTFSPAAKFQFVTTDDATPGTVTSWDSRHTVFGLAGGTGAGVGFSNTSSTSTENISFLSPTVAWQNAKFQAHTFSFLSDQVFQGFYQNATGLIGIGTTSPTALLHIKAGTATASTAPLKFTSGTNLTTPENGVVEYDGTNYYVTDNSTRFILTKTLVGTAAPATTPTAVGVHFIDTVNKKEYVATGTSSSADWTILN